MEGTTAEIHVNEEGKSDVYIQDPQHLGRSLTGQMIFDPFVQ